MRQTVNSRDDGFTVIELLIVVGIISVISAIGIAQVMRARNAANESAAISSIRTIVAGQIAFANSCGRGGYALALPTLGQPALGSNVPYVSPDLTGAVTVQKSGYAITTGPSAIGGPGPADCNGNPTDVGFYATAEPLTHGRTGGRSFAANHTTTIWADLTATAPTEPFGAPATPIQ